MFFPQLIGKFLVLPCSEQALLLQAILLELGIALGLRVFPFGLLRKLLKNLTLVARTMVLQSSSPDRVAWAVMTISRHVPGTRNCLVQALAGQVLLESTGYRTSLRFGVRAARALEAHAWLESAGSVVIGHSRPGELSPLRNRREVD
jgi:hypothetical protein